MRGRIFSRFKGSYSIVLSLGKDPGTGKYRQHFESIKGTRKDAEKRLSELLHQLDVGIFVKPGKMTVKDYLEQWLSDYCKPNLADRTTEGYEYMVQKYLTSSLGILPLTALKPEHLQHLYSDMLKKPLSNRTVRYCHVTIHKALSIALKMGMVGRNVADAVEPPKVVRREMKTMNETDMHIFLELARGTPYYALFYTALFTGMRRSELLGLRWSNVDLLLLQVSITRGLQQLKNGELVFRPPKTQKSRRLISLTPSNCLVLKEHYESQKKLRESIGMTLSDDDLVFSQSDGKPLLPNSISHAWEKLRNRAGLNGVRLHDARHTHASLLLKQGVHPKIVQERLGHSSIQITLDTYSHVAPGLQQAAANRFDDIALPKQRDTLAENGL